MWGRAGASAPKGRRRHARCELFRVRGVERGCCAHLGVGADTCGKLNCTGLSGAGRLTWEVAPMRVGRACIEGREATQGGHALGQNSGVQGPVGPLQGSGGSAQGF
eukprot:365486-Chlamydomonas_euryale.AAC.18